MPRRERIKKPEPERTQPIRSWGTLFGAAGPTPGSPPPSASPSSRGASDRADGRGPAPADPISHGVQAGYRVIEDYVRQGQSAARMMWGPMLGGMGGAGATGGAGGTGGTFGLGGGEELQQRFGAMIRTATDLATLWLDFFGSGPWGRGGPVGFGAQRPAPPPGAVPPPPFSAGVSPASSAPAAPPAAPASNGSQHGGPIVSVEVTSARRTEVILDLRPSSAELSLRVHDLRAVDAEAPRLKGVSVEGVPGEDRVVVRVLVPDQHPPGLDSGMILDDRTGLPRGTLAVRVVASGTP